MTDINEQASDKELDELKGKTELLKKARGIISYEKRRLTDLYEEWTNLVLKRVSMTKEIREIRSREKELEKETRVWELRVRKEEYGKL